MEQYIPKAPVVAEIERLKNKAIRWAKCKGGSEYEIGKRDAYNIALFFLDTLEVKEVDLEKEITRVSKNEYFDFTDWKSIARHFFELGLKAQKGK